MVAIATGFFIALLTFGWDYLGWGKVVNDEVQMGLFLAFLLGVVAGFKVKG